MTIDDIRTVNKFAEYIVDSYYKEEDCGYAELMNKVEEKIKWFYNNEESLFDDEENDDWRCFCGETITLYRTIPTRYEKHTYIDKEDRSNVGMSWVSSIEELERVPWYDEHTTILTVTIPTDDKTYIAFNNYTDRIIEVVLPNASKHYDVQVYRSRRTRNKRLRRR